MGKFKTQEEITTAVRDYVKSGDSARTVARRHNVSPYTLTGWLKRVGLHSPRPRVNWESVKAEALR